MYPGGNQLDIFWVYPRTTHCNLLHLICNDVPVEYQLIYRFCTFYNALISSNNVITNTCAILALAGSRSAISNNISHVAQYMNCERVMVSSVKCKTTCSLYASEANIIKSSLIRDLCNTKYQIN